MLVLENSEKFLHQNTPSSEEMFLKETKINWYPVSLDLRVDFVKSLSFQDIIYTNDNLGFELT